VGKEREIVSIIVSIKRSINKKNEKSEKREKGKKEEKRRKKKNSDTRTDIFSLDLAPDHLSCVLPPPFLISIPSLVRHLALTRARGGVEMKAWVF